MTQKQFKKQSEKAKGRFRRSFRSLSRNLTTVYENEKDEHDQNFKSGKPLEEHFRRQIKQYIPSNFAIDIAEVEDANGFTCGECDLVIYDSRYAPLLRLPTTEDSQTKYMAFETTYGIIEVKQTLNYDSLRAACEKIFAYKQLTRNEHFFGQQHSEFLRANPPFGVIFAYASNFDFSQADRRTEFSKFVKELHSQIDKSAYVNAIFVLNSCTCTWIGEMNALQRWNSSLHHPILQIFPEHSPDEDLYFHVEYTQQDTLYRLYEFLWHTLMSIQLLPLSFAAYYD